jgi:hypothetical protein
VLPIMEILLGLLYWNYFEGGGKYKFWQVTYKFGELLDIPLTWFIPLPVPYSDSF